METEDPFLGFVKAKLEEDARVPAERLAAIEAFAAAQAPSRNGRGASWRLRRFALPLAAAALAVCCGVFLLTKGTPLPDSEQEIAQIIDLLQTTTSDASESEIAAATPERLLAWQDAPYDEIENERVSSL